MSAQSAQFAGSPLERLATAVPPAVAYAAGLAARVAGVALALWYAYDQDTLFPTEHFPRTWAIVALVGVLTLLSASPWRYPGAAFASAFGAGMLVFGGANLAERGSGVGVLACGVVAWLAAAIWNHRRGAPVVATVGGLFAAAVLTFVFSVAVGFALEN